MNPSRGIRVGMGKTALAATSIHSIRANGGSFFTVEDLTRVKNNLEHLVRIYSLDLHDLIEKVDKEIEYIKVIK